MDFEPSESQRELAALVRQILDDQVTQERLRVVEQGPDHFDRALWAALAKAGVLAAALPESVGGGGLGIAEQCSVLIEIGRAVAPVPYLWSVAVAASALAEFGAPELAEQTGRGEVTATAALSEELLDALDAPATQAERVDGGWRLDGAKAAVPSLPVADVLLVPATTPDGVAVFVVPASAEGVTVQRQVVVDGDAAGSLELVGVVVPDGSRLGGVDVRDRLVDRATIALSAYQVGVLERALELTAQYAREREQFDRPIGSFQAVAQRLADAYIDVEAARLTMWEAAWRLGEGLPAGAELATSKFWAADAGHRVAHTAVHVHGGAGIDMDAPTHRYFTAAKRTEFTLGNATAALRRLGAELASAPA
jgi:acyl-CoA dehydrogenase